eukprot:jgi/Chlat1/4637/Chrsp3S05595
MADEAHAAEQEMEIEALQAILMDDLQEIDPQSTDALKGEGRCFQITLSPKASECNDDEDEPTEIPVRMAFIFAHTPNYPDEPPIIKIRSLKGASSNEAEELQRLVSEEVEKSLGMAMVFSLVSLAKDWLREKFNPERLDEVDAAARAAELEAQKLEEARRHGTQVTPETFASWSTRFEAEAALERAKLATGSAVKGKVTTGRKWFETNKGAALAGEEELDDDEEEFNPDDFDEEEDAMLDEYLNEHK